MNHYESSQADISDALSEVELGTMILEERAAQCEIAAMDVLLGLADRGLYAIEPEEADLSGEDTSHGPIQP